MEMCPCYTFRSVGLGSQSGDFVPMAVTAQGIVCGGSLFFAGPAAAHARIIPELQSLLNGVNDGVEESEGSVS